MLPTVDATAAGLPKRASVPAPTKPRRQRQRRRRRDRWVIAGASAILAAVLFPFTDRLTAHPGETVILLMPPILGGILYLGWPAVRRIRLRQYASYLMILTAVIAAAIFVAAKMASGRVLWGEVLWAVYFTVAWRIAWGLYKRTIGRTGERHRRWGRFTRRCGSLHQRRAARWTRIIAPIRAAVVVFVFAPLVVGSLIHRIKIGNDLANSPYSALALEEVCFRTGDGLLLSGWFLSAPRSDTTVLICHGAGANKGNFIGFVEMLEGQGFSTLIYDARGHGESDGHTSTFGLFETADVTAAVDWLKSKQPERARHVYALGSSMGAMTLVRSAADDSRIEAVVLDSCFLSAPRLAHQHLGRLPILGPLFADLGLAAMSLHAGQSFWQLDAAPAIARLAPRPVLLIHGEEDFVIAPVNLELLYDLAREPKAQWLGPGQHSNILTTDYYAYQRRVLKFLRDARRGPTDAKTR